MKLFKRPSPALVVAALGLFAALGGAGMAATGGTFVLGGSNAADKTTALTVSTLPDATACPAPCPALKVTNNSTAAHTGGLSVLNKSTSTPAATVQSSGGAPALRLLVNPGKAPLTVNSGGKVANLNADLLDGKDSSSFLPADGKAGDADKLDGLDSTDFVRSSTVQYVQPRFIPPYGAYYELAHVGGLTFDGLCWDTGTQQEAWLFVQDPVAHAGYADLTQPGAGGTYGNADANTDRQYLAYSKLASGTKTFTPVTGSLLRADGSQVFYDLYMSQNPGGWTDGTCAYGGSFVVTPPPPAG